MAGVVIDAAIQFVIQSLMCKAKLIIEVKADLEKLKKALEIISILSVDAERRKVSNMAVKLWLKRLEDVAFDADNVLDEINYEVLRDNTMPKPSIMTKMKNIFSSSRDKFAHKIREINTRLDLISEEASKFGLQRIQYSPDVASETSPHIDMNSTFIGRENDMATILELLFNALTEQVLSILPIVGMGGVGKTMLAANVFHDENIQSHFKTRIWIHVSRHFDSKSLLKRILSKIQGKTDPDMDKDALLEGLQQALHSKRFLLILDDVWIANHEEGRQWVDLMMRLRSICSTKGNAIITTMRSRSIPSAAGTLSTYELKGLSRDNCWSIIKADALGEEDRRSSWFRTVGTKIAKRCQGLPLAAKTVAGLLNGKSKDDWLSVKEKWLSGVEGQQKYILNQLKLSVDHLPSDVDDLPLVSLKKCFAYISVFPKGSRVEREQLIELWMAEGFLQNKNMEKQTSDMESVGNRVVSLLVQHYLLQVVHIDETRVELYSMHDLMHDLAASLLDSSRYVRRSESLSTQPKNRAKVRSLFYQGKISDLIFSDFKSMHALTLSGNINELPDSIRELLHLRLLDITETKIEALPDSTGKLFHLQTFRACQPLFGSAPLKKLPVTFKYLVSLRHIKVSGETELPPHVGLLTSLQTLPFFKVRNEEGYRIVELQNLKNLKGELKIENLENVQGEEESSKAYLFEKSEIVRLTLMWNGVGEDDHENVLKGLQPHTNLKILQISGFKGASFPSWILKMAVYRRGTGWVGLDNIVELKLISCHECEEIPVLGHLPRLQSLHLSDLKNVKIISSSFYAIEKCSMDDGVHKETITVFPALERLEMLDMPNLEAWADVETPSAVAVESEVKVFPRLEYLEIKNCNQLRSAPRHFPCLKELKTGMMTAGLFIL